MMRRISFDPVPFNDAGDGAQSRLAAAMMPTSKIGRRERVTYTGRLTKRPPLQASTWKATSGASTVNDNPSGA